MVPLLLSIHLSYIIYTYQYMNLSNPTNYTCPEVQHLKLSKVKMKQDCPGRHPVIQLDCLNCCPQI
uniref:Uncharacterized protein n=1 Tax=Erpetoichthys calabaricus TaxID=27687 RepID=A0A8C4SDC6_ERPCA